jgi:hypothetical protein
MRNAVFWDVTPRASCKNRRFGERYHLCHQDDKDWRIFLLCVLQMLVTANVVLSTPIIFTVMMEAIQSFETLILTGATRRNIPEDGILQFYSSFARSR